MKISRKNALKSLAGLTFAGTLGLHSINPTPSKKSSNQTYRHSVCRWTYGNKSLDELCEAAVDIGIDSIELINPDEFDTIKKYGLTCGMVNQVPLSLTDGFNDPSLHDKLLKEYKAIFPKVAEVGFKNIICFSGNRKGLNDEQGLENCAIGLEPVVKNAEEYGLTICMELLNSKVDHPDYQCDHTEWGVALVEKLGLDNFKLLYDIYHMQIMEGDIIATIRKYSEYIGHYHTGGVPGRNEIDDTQELNYTAIMEAISEMGFKGFVAQEFIPTNEDVFASLRQGIGICSI